MTRLVNLIAKLGVCTYKHNGQHKRTKGSREPMANEDDEKVLERQSP